MVAKYLARSGKKGRVHKQLLQEKQPPRMSADEKRLVRQMHFEQGLSRADVARALNRNLSSICRLLAQKKTPAPIGRPVGLSEKQIDKLCVTIEKMVDAADANFEVSLAMVMRRSRVKVCDRVVANALHDRGYWFRDLRHKPILTPADVKARYKFSKKYKDKLARWWLQSIHIHLDNKHFKVATTAAGRRLLAKRKVRGVYRKKEKSLRSGHVKPHPKTRLATGPRGFLKAGGVGGGKVLVWHTVEKNWGGAEAEQLYADVVAPALKERYPEKRKYVVLEDNDPSGNRSKRGMDAKTFHKMKVFEIPKRSPDLNVLDYAVWSEVERRMRAQERKWRVVKTETRAQFGVRLDRTARNLPKAFIDKAVSSLARRCQLLYDARGGLFEEGGRSRRRPL